MGQDGEPSCQLRDYPIDQLESIIETQEQSPFGSPGKCHKLDELKKRLVEHKATMPLPPTNIMSGLNTAEAKARLRSIDKHLPTDAEVDSIIYETRTKRQ